jgi:uncharacterized damage-inducible protein DinB
MRKTEIVTLFDYDRWATDEQLKVIAGLREEQYLRDLGTSFGSIHRTLVHIFGAQKVWLARWHGQSPARLISADEIHTLAALKENWSTLRTELGAFLELLTEDKLATPLAYKDMKGNAYSQPLVEQMQHVANHSTYHRGQITSMLRQVGATPVSTDLIGYYRTRSSATLS